jgi:selenocysteine-specific elongation factor
VSAPLTLGTAGHIDHGKTALVHALTGRATDRLPEEKRRGISIALGYAALVLPNGRRLSVIDVPGHERFVRTMVAGATGIDLYLLCVAADDGVMPQTREHCAVLRHLGVTEGVVAITKSDLFDPEAAAEEVGELMPGAETVAVSVRQRSGLPELLAALERSADRLPSRAEDQGEPRLHVDRSFTLRGIGTVVTGTLWSGSVSAGDRVVVLPRGLEARVRSVQVHDEPVERAVAGQRVALALTGVDWREVGRGDLLSGAGSDIEPTYRIDAHVEFEPGTRPRRGERLHVHHGTREAPARLVPLDDGLAQLRLEAPLMPLAGDRLVLRRLAPPDTIGGGVVLDERPRRHGPAAAVVERLRALERGESPPESSSNGGTGEEAASTAPSVPEPPKLDASSLELAAMLRADGERPRADGDLAADAGLDPGDAAKRLGALVKAGLAVRVARNLHFDPVVLETLTTRIVTMCERDGEATIAGVRDELDTTRRYAQALLEYLDTQRVTRRQGDAHVLRRR